MSEFDFVDLFICDEEKIGFDAQEILLLQDRLGHLPKVLLDYYAECGRVKITNRIQDYLLSPDKVRWSKNNDYLVFYMKNWAHCAWAIKRNDLEDYNPPVYISYDEDNWEEETASLMEFLKAMMYLQLIFKSKFSSQQFYYLDEFGEELKQIESRFAKKPFQLLHWDGGISFYGNHAGEIIAVFSNREYAYAAHSKQSFLKMDEFLSGLTLN